MIWQCIAMVLFYGTRNCTSRTIQNVVISTGSCTNTQKTFCISSQNSCTMKKKQKPGRGLFLYLIKFSFNFLDPPRILNILSKFFLVLDNPLSNREDFPKRNYFKNYLISLTGILSWRSRRKDIFFLFKICKREREAFVRDQNLGITIIWFAFSQKCWNFPTFEKPLGHHGVTFAL